MRASLFAAAALLIPAPVVASCLPGGVPSYGDVSYVYVRQYSLTGIRYPSFEFEATAARRKAAPTVSLVARRAVPFIGSFVAVDPERTLGDIVAVLERGKYFDMHLTAPFCCYLDGPEDVVTVVRCGVKTSLATITEGGEANLDDAQGKAFFRLEDTLRKAIFAEKWTEPTPAPP